MDVVIVENVSKTVFAWEDTIAREYVSVRVDANPFAQARIECTLEVPSCGHATSAPQGPDDDGNVMVCPPSPHNEGGTCLTRANTHEPRPAWRERLTMFSQPSTATRLL